MRNPEDSLLSKFLFYVIYGQKATRYKLILLICNFSFWSINNVNWMNLSVVALKLMKEGCISYSLYSDFLIKYRLVATLGPATRSSTAPFCYSFIFSLCNWFNVQLFHLSWIFVIFFLYYYSIRFILKLWDKLKKHFDWNKWMHVWLLFIWIDVIIDLKW